MMQQNQALRNILHTADERPSVLVHVAGNVRRLRAAAHVSQAALAAAAGVSRRMLVAVEKGDVNVSLTTLDRLAEALGASFPALVAPPDAGDSARVDALAWAGDQPASRARLLASTPAATAVELWSGSLAPGERYRSAADPSGWQNMIVVVAGELSVALGDQRFTIAAGDFEVFASSEAHAFGNDTDTVVHFIRNVIY